MNNAKPSRQSKISAAHIVIRAAAAEPNGLPTQPQECSSESGNQDRITVATTSKPSPSSAADEAFIAGLRKLVAEGGTNRNDLAVVVISACLDVGIQKGPEIRRITTILGFNSTHIRIQLDLGVQDKRWACIEKDTYCSLETTA